MIRMKGTAGGGGGGGGSEGSRLEGKDELHVGVPSSENSLLNIICKVLCTFTNPFSFKI